MRAQEPKQTNLVGTYVRLEKEIDERLEELADHRGMKAHIIKTGIRKEIEYLESLRKSQELKAS